MNDSAIKMLTLSFYLTSVIVYLPMSLTNPVRHAFILDKKSYTAACYSLLYSSMGCESLPCSSTSLTLRYFGCM